MNPTSPGGEVFAMKSDLATSHREELAAFYDIEQGMNQEFLKRVVTFLNMKGQSGTTAPAQNRGKTEYTANEDTMILDGINKMLPAIIDKEDHKNRHIALVKMVSSRLMIGGTHGPAMSWEASLIKTLNGLYGNWKVFDNNTRVKVAFNRSKLNAAGVGQDQWDDSAHYMFMMAHRKYKGKISFVPRVDEIKLLKHQGELAKSLLMRKTEDATKYPKPEGGEKEWKPYQQDMSIPLFERVEQGATEFATMRYQEHWNAVYKDIVTDGGGNIFIARINDSDDPNKIRMVIATGDRNDPNNIRIIGDVYGVDTVGNAVPVTFTQENAITMMQARQAWQHANSQDDIVEGMLDITGIGGIWDGLDPISASARALEWAREKMGMDPMQEKDKLFNIEDGGDFGRAEFKWLYENYSKAAWEKKYDRKYSREEAANGDYKGFEGYSDRGVNAFGGRYLTEIMAPGRVEMDLFYEPLWNEVMAFEKSKGREVTDQELYSIFQVVKRRLNGKPDFFGNDRGRTMFDAYVLNNWDDGEPKPLFKEAWEAPQSDITDYVGRKFSTEVGKVDPTAGTGARMLFDIFRNLNPNIPSGITK